jgi:HK97 family phage portal protein
MEQRALDLPDWPSILTAGVQTAAGISVNPVSAMGCTPVKISVGLISSALATLPASLIEKGVSGQRRVASDHPVSRLLVDANDWTPTSELIEQLTVDAVLTGSGFAYINRVGDEIRELIRVRPDAVSVTLDQRTGEPNYKIGSDPVARQNILHIKAPGSLDVKGDSPTIQGREAIGLCLTLQNHAARLFGNSARPGGVISFPADMTADAATKAKDMWQASTSGENAGRTAVLYGGGKWDQMQLSSVDAQFAELWDRAAVEVFRVYGVPPPLGYDLSEASWANMTACLDIFFKFTLNRWIESWTSQLRLKLLNSDERQRFFIELDTDQLLAADLQARADAYQKLISSRILNPNEARERESLPPYTGGDKFENPNTSSVTIHGSAAPKSAGGNTDGQ